MRALHVLTASVGLSAMIGGTAFGAVSGSRLPQPPVSAHGKRWARHWLDLVRFAETQGFENDGIRPHAWRYRDYVIRAFNADKPYDRFLKEQLAGDELYLDDPDAITATGYARLGAWDELST